MKNIIFILIAVLLIGLTSCGNANKPGADQVNEQAIKDSIKEDIMDSIQTAEQEKVRQDSIAAYELSHSDATIKAVVKQALSAYINTGDIQKYLTLRFKNLVKRYNSKGYDVGWCPILGLGTGPQLDDTFSVKGVSKISENTAMVTFVLTVILEGDDLEAEKMTCHAYLVYDDGQWLIDDFEDPTSGGRHSKAMSR